MQDDALLFRNSISSLLAGGMVRGRRRAPRQSLQSLAARRRCHACVRRISSTPSLAAVRRRVVDLHRRLQLGDVRVRRLTRGHGRGRGLRVDPAVRHDARVHNDKRNEVVGAAGRRQQRRQDDRKGQGLPAVCAAHRVRVPRGECLHHGAPRARCGRHRSSGGSAATRLRALSAATGTAQPGWRHVRQVRRQPAPCATRGAGRPAAHAVPHALSTPLPPAGQADKFMRPGDPCGWAGISCFVGTAVILLAAFVMRAGTLPPESAY